MMIESLRKTKWEKLEISPNLRYYVRPSSSQTSTRILSKPTTILESELVASEYYQRCSDWISELHVGRSGYTSKELEHAVAKIQVSMLPHRDISSRAFADIKIEIRRQR